MTINVGDTVWVVNTETVEGLEILFDLGDVGKVRRAWTPLEWFEIDREDGLRQIVHAEHIAKVPAL